MDSEPPAWMCTFADDTKELFYYANNLKAELSILEKVITDYSFKSSFMWHENPMHFIVGLSWPII